MHERYLLQDVLHHVIRPLSFTEKSGNIAIFVQLDGGGG